MRLYRCAFCGCGFAILSVPRSPETKGGKGITCPLCLGKNVKELDPVEAVGATLARKALELWSKLPSGD